MTASAPQTPPAQTLKRRPWRLFTVVGVIALLLFIGYYLRGTWATASPTDPDSPRKGPICQLVLSPDGHKVIRTAVLLPVPVETAWKVLSDYSEWERLFKTIRENKAEVVGPNQHHVVSSVTTPMGTLNLDFIVTHEKLPEGGYRAWWDAPTRELPVNHGEIRITPKGKDNTLLVYTVHKEYSTYPTFLVNNMLLGQQKDLVRTLGQRIVEISKE
jgi:Polyketide cyclase / dehydrase and lipid transport